MGTGFEHTALAVFTTLAPMGAGAFIALAYAFIAGAPDETAAKRLDCWTALPLAVLAAGFLGAFMHLASPLNAFGVFAGIGSSPLSNEILVGVVFAAVAVVYWALALAGKLSSTLRKALLVALAALAVVFAAFCGLAYMMYTIPTWNTPLSIVQMIGYLLAGGTVLGFCTVGFAQVGLPKGAGTVALALTLVGVAVGTVGFGIGKAGEVPDAIRKGIEDAKKNLVKISLRGTTIPHEVIGIYDAGKVLMKPAAPGTGVIAGGPVRAVVEAAGIKDIRTKALRSYNPCNVVRATLEGLKSLRTAEEVAVIRGKSVKEIL